MRILADGIGTVGGTGGVAVAVARLTAEVLP